MVRTLRIGQALRYRRSRLLNPPPKPEPSSPYTFVNSEAQAWHTAAVAAGAQDNATVAEKGAVDRFVGSLKAAGVWSRLIQVNLGAAWASTAVRVCLKDATLKGAFTGGAHYRSRGLYLNGVADEFDTQFVPNASSSFGLNDACIGLDVRENAQNATPTLSTNSATILALVGPRNTSNKIATRLNSSATTTITGTVATSYGLTTVSRSSAASEEIYRDGVLLPANATASTGRQTTSIRIGRSNTSYVARQMILFFAAQSLDATMQAALAAAWNQYKADLGIGMVYTDLTPLLSVAQTLPQVDQKVLPDGAYATQAGKGYPSTGLHNAPDGTLWGGRGLGTMQAMAGIVHMAFNAGPNDATVPAAPLFVEYTTANLFAAIGYTPGTTGAANTYPAASSTQGVQIALGGSANNYDVTWVAVDSTNSRNYYCVARWNGTTLTAISCSALPSTGHNSVVPSDTRGQAWVLNVSGATMNRATIASGVLTAGTSALVNGGNLDQMTYVEEIDSLIITTGPNGGPSYVIQAPLVGDYGAPHGKAAYDLTNAKGIEGVVYRADWQRFLTINDQWTHDEPPFNFNGLHLHGPVTLS